jgi:hypothetical protein
MMKFKLKTLSLIAATFISTISHAQVISEYVFTQNGGDLNNIKATIADANEPLRVQSYDRAFNAVGHIYGCTATWLGDDGEWVYILAAAHCNEATKDVTNTDYIFYADDEKTVIASGGTVHTVPERNHRPAGYGGASTDLEILKLKKVADYRDKNGKKVVKPVLYDGNEEKDKPVQFVGYGLWGVNVTENETYGPKSGQRRLTSMSVIDSIFEMNHGIGAGYEPVKESTKWGRTAPGDSGSAWWQTHQGIKTIIAVTNGGASRSSTGARISQYIDWIKSVYPEVDVLSEHAFNWSDNDRKGTLGTLYEYDNPYNGDKEYFMLQNVGKDGRYWYFPTNKNNNSNWVYLGTDKKAALENIKTLQSFKDWSANGHQGVAGDIYIYYNPYNNATELFRLKHDGQYWYFPTNKKSNKDWEYLQDVKF